MGVAAKTANDFSGEMICQPFFHASWREGRGGEGRRGEERGGEERRGEGRGGEERDKINKDSSGEDKCGNLPPSLSKDCSFTFSSGIMCCLLYCSKYNGHSTSESISYMYVHADHMYCVHVQTHYLPRTVALYTQYLVYCVMGAQLRYIPSTQCTV